MRWITQSWAVGLAVLPLSAAVVASCASAPGAGLAGASAHEVDSSQHLKGREMLASGAAGIAALAGRVHVAMTRRWRRRSSCKKMARASST